MTLWSHLEQRRCSHRPDDDGDRNGLGHRTRILPSRPTVGRQECWTWRGFIQRGNQAARGRSPDDKDPRLSISDVLVVDCNVPATTPSSSARRWSRSVAWSALGPAPPEGPGSATNDGALLCVLEDPQLFRLLCAGARGGSAGPLPFLPKASSSSDKRSSSDICRRESSSPFDGGEIN